MFKYLTFFFLLLALTSCKEKAAVSDAYGNFEATTVMVSSESNGRLLFLKATEGETLKAGTLVAIVDTTQLHLQRKQIEASMGVLPKKTPNNLCGY